MERYSLDRQHVNRLPKDDVLAEMRRVAAKMGNRRFSRREFDRHAKHCKGSTVLKNFGAWDQALRTTDLELAPHRTKCPPKPIRRRRYRLPPTCAMFPSS